MMTGEFNEGEIALLVAAASSLDFGGVLPALKIVSWYGPLKEALLLNPSIDYDYAMSLVQGAEEIALLRQNPAWDLWSMEQGEIARQDPANTILSSFFPSDYFTK
jgi:hypothetical protein